MSSKRQSLDFENEVLPPSCSLFPLLGLVPPGIVDQPRRNSASQAQWRLYHQHHLDRRTERASNGAGLYGSSKAFIGNVTRGMAKELIPFGIRVNAVAPGVITTPFHERYSTQAQLDAALATIPQDRLGVAEDCIGAYLFLASNELSGYIIGQTIEVNGGQLMP